MTVTIDTQEGTTLNLTCSQCYQAAISIEITREMQFGRPVQVLTIAPASQGSYIDCGKAFCAPCAEEIHEGQQQFARMVARCG